MASKIRTYASLTTGSEPKSLASLYGFKTQKMPRHLQGQENNVKATIFLYYETFTFHLRSEPTIHTQNSPLDKIFIS